jgi:hypothetical protein
MTGLEKAMEKGLPRAANPRPRDSFSMLMLMPLEQVTTALRRGDDFSAQAVHDLEAFCQRAAALRAALDARINVLED